MKSPEVLIIHPLTTLPQFVVLFFVHPFLRPPDQVYLGLVAMKRITKDKFSADRTDVDFTDDSKISSPGLWRGELTCTS